MGKGLWIGLGILGGAIAGVAIVLERKPVGAAVREVARTVSSVAQRATETAQRAATVIFTGTSKKRMQKMVDNIVKYRIAQLVDQYHGMVPFGMAMAIFEHESVYSFDPTIFNWYKNYLDYVDQSVPTIDSTKKHELPPNTAGVLGYPNDHATPGAPLVDKWRKPGDGGCAHDPHACGLGQILDNIRVKSGFKFGGVSLPYLNDLFDPEKNIHASLANINSELAKWKIVARAGGDSWLLNALCYWIHANGAGTLVGGPGRAGAFNRISGSVTWDKLASLPWTKASGLGTLSNSIHGITDTVNRAGMWEKAHDTLLAGQAPSMEPSVPQPMSAIERLGGAWGAELTVSHDGDLDTNVSQIMAGTKVTQPLFDHIVSLAHAAGMTQTETALKTGASEFIGVL